MNKIPFTLLADASEIGHSMSFGPTSTGMTSNFSFNSFKELSSDDEATVVELLIAVADIDPSEDEKEKADQVIEALAGKDASMLDVVQAFERVPELNEWAARLRRNALPGNTNGLI